MPHMFEFVFLTGQVEKRNVSARQFKKQNKQQAINTHSLTCRVSYLMWASAQREIRQGQTGMRNYGIIPGLQHVSNIHSGI